MRVMFTKTQFETFAEWLNWVVESQQKTDSKVLAQLVIGELYVKVKKRMVVVNVTQKTFAMTFKPCEAFAILILSNDSENYVVKALRNEIHQKIS